MKDERLAIAVTMTLFLMALTAAIGAAWMEIR